MGFITSIILLYIAGLFSHYFYIYGKKREKNHMWIVYYGICVYFFFLIGGILLYFDALPFVVDIINEIVWIDVPYENGADFMWNEVRIFGLDSNIDPNSDFIRYAIILWICYLPMYLYGKTGSQLLFGRRVYQRGAFWALLPGN